MLLLLLFLGVPLDNFVASFNDVMQVVVITVIDVVVVADVVVVDVVVVDVVVMS